MLQLMIDAKTEDQQRLTNDQIVTHSVTFLLAGYETTSTALAYISYLLALHPDIQNTLQQHIDNYYRDNPVSTIVTTTVCCHSYHPSPLRKHLCTTLLRK